MGKFFASIFQPIINLFVWPIKEGIYAILWTVLIQGPLLLINVTLKAITFLVNNTLLFLIVKTPSVIFCGIRIPYVLFFFIIFSLLFIIIFLAINIFILAKQKNTYRFREYVSKSAKNFFTALPMLFILPGLFIASAYGIKLINKIFGLINVNTSTTDFASSITGLFSPNYQSIPSPYSVPWNVADAHVFLGIVLSILVLVQLVFLAIELCKKIYLLIVLFFISPLAACSIMVDDGKRFYKWKQMAMPKFFSIIGVFFGLSIFGLILNYGTLIIQSASSQLKYILSIIMAIITVIGLESMPRLFSKLFGGDFNNKGLIHHTKKSINKMTSYYTGGIIQPFKMTNQNVKNSFPSLSNSPLSENTYQLPPFNQLQSTNFSNSLASSNSAAFDIAKQSLNFLKQKAKSMSSNALNSNGIERSVQV